jgi:hypothetical protein
MERENLLPAAQLVSPAFVDSCDAALRLLGGAAFTHTERV